MKYSEKVTIKVSSNDEMVNINTVMIHKNCKCMNDYFLIVPCTQIAFLKTAKEITHYSISQVKTHLGVFEFVPCIELISKTMSNICNCSVTTGISQTDVNGQGRVNLSISCWIILFILRCVHLSQTDLNGQVMLNQPVRVALCMSLL